MLNDGELKYAKDLGAGWGGEAFGKGLAAMTIEGNWITGAMQADFPNIKYKVVELPKGPADAVLGRRPLLANNDVRIGYVVADRPSPLYRDAVGDECLYVEAGSAAIETSFGTLTHCLHLLLSNARQRACSFKFKAQLLSQNACREWDFGTAAMATIGNPYKRPIGSHLVAKP